MGLLCGWLTKVIDRVTIGTEEEEEIEVTDRAYWDNQSTKRILKEVDSIFGELREIVSGYELNYTKPYIGLSKDGVAKNFFLFVPKKVPKKGS